MVLRFLNVPSIQNIKTSEAIKVYQDSRKNARERKRREQRYRLGENFQLTA